jgi:hypothetical protein
MSGKIQQDICDAFIVVMEKLHEECRDVDVDPMIALNRALSDRVEGAAKKVESMRSILVDGGAGLVADSSSYAKEMQDAERLHQEALTEYIRLAQLGEWIVGNSFMKETFCLRMETTFACPSKCRRDRPRLLEEWLLKLHIPKTGKGVKPTLQGAIDQWSSELVQNEIARCECCLEDQTCMKLQLTCPDVLVVWLQRLTFKDQVRFDKRFQRDEVLFIKEGVIESVFLPETTLPQQAGSEPTKVGDKYR